MSDDDAFLAVGNGRGVAERLSRTPDDDEAADDEAADPGGRVIDLLLCRSRDEDAMGGHGA